MHTHKVSGPKLREARLNLGKIKIKCQAIETYVRSSGSRSDALQIHKFSNSGAPTNSPVDAGSREKNPPDQWRDYAAPEMDCEPPGPRPWGKNTEEDQDQKEPKPRRTETETETKRIEHRGGPSPERTGQDPGLKQRGKGTEEDQNPEGRRKGTTPRGTWPEADRPRTGT